MYFDNISEYNANLKQLTQLELINVAKERMDV